MKRYIFLFPVLLSSVISIAQTANDTINRMVLVESTYNPVIVGAVKHNFIPEEVKPAMSKEKVVYADENVDLTNFDREAQPAQAMEIAPEKGTSGYAHLGYGNYNNLNGLAAYKWQLNANNNLSFKAHADGWNGNLKLHDDTKWRSHLYDMGIDADYHTLLGNASLNIGGHGAYYNYNYLSNESTNIQKANSLGAHASINGVAKEYYYYRANINYTRFDRSFYWGEEIPHSENHIHGEVSLSKDLYKWGMASVQLRSDVLTYQGLADYHNYFSLEITPQWEYQLGKFQFTSGFNMDILGGSNATHPIQLSPECKISYIPENRFTVHLTLDGGREMYSFDKLYERSPYWTSTGQLRPSYTFLNANLEGGLRIFEGLHLHIGGGYKIISNALLETVTDTLNVTYTGISNHNVKIATADAGISYNHRDFANLSVKGAYYHWMLQGDQSLLARAPQFDINVDARIRIIPNLYAYTNLECMMFTDTEVMPRERAIIEWGLGAHYTLNKRFTFFFDTHNLLNRRYSYYTGYPSQGFNVMAGAMFKF